MKKKLILIVPSMRGGGSEKVMSILANTLDRNKFDITLVLLRHEGEYLKDIKEDIKLVDLKSKQIRYSIWKLYKLIKSESPDIVFSTLGSMNLILAFLKPVFKNIKFIARESSIVSIKNKKEKYPKLFNFLYTKIYNNFDMIVCQSNYMQKDMLENYKISNDKTVVINNPVDLNKIEELSQCKELLFKNEKINLLAVGRLEAVKGFELLVQVISKLDARFHLNILGDGSQKFFLEELAIRLQVNDRISFLGFQDNPYKYMKQADIFILSSRYEGFPNVVLEANACGTPVIAFDCPGGTGEIIENGLNGYVVECGNVEALYKSILQFDKKLFSEKEIKSLISKRYSLDNIIDKYENIME